MKLDELWDDFLTRGKYFWQDLVNFLFQLAVWAVGIVIIIILGVKEFFERRVKKWKCDNSQQKA